MTGVTVAGVPFTQYRCVRPVGNKLLLTLSYGIAHIDRGNEWVGEQEKSEPALQRWPCKLVWSCLNNVNMPPATKWRDRATNLLSYNLDSLSENSQQKLVFDRMNNPVFGEWKRWIFPLSVCLPTRAELFIDSSSPNLGAFPLGPPFALVAWRQNRISLSTICSSECH